MILRSIKDKLLERRFSGMFLMQIVDAKMVAVVDRVLLIAHVFLVIMEVNVNCWIIALTTKTRKKNFAL